MSFFTQSLAMGGVPPSIARRGEIPLLSSLPANATFTGGPQYCEDNAETLKTAGADEAQFPGMRLVGTDWLPTASDGAKNHPTVNGVPQFYPNRQDSTAYILADIVNFAGVYWECTTAGTSDSSAPATRDGEDTSPSKSIGETITDGTIVWQYAGRYQDRVGYLSEEARTNSVLGSCSFGDATYWGGANFFTLTEVNSIIEGQSAWKHLSKGGFVYRAAASYSFGLSRTDVASVIIEQGDASEFNFILRNTDTSINLGDCRYNWITGVVTTTAGDATSVEILAEEGPNNGKVVRLSLTITSADSDNGDDCSFILYPVFTTSAEVFSIIHHAQLELGTDFATSPIITEAATVTRPATICELPSARYIRPNDFAIQGYCIPEAAGQSGTIWSSYTDANNYTSLSISATEVILNKRLSGTSNTATVTYSHAADTPFQWQAFFDSTDGIGLRTREWSGLDWGAWETWVEDATATDIATPALQIGSINDTVQFNGTIPVANFKKISGPKTYLIAHPLY